MIKQCLRQVICKMVNVIQLPHNAAVDQGGFSTATPQAEAAGDWQRGQLWQGLPPSQVNFYQ